ncbi:hypothetical protein BU25DRAFT_101036 [Macroventuria anomochaeta]|uniref:Uncharacterized protein n=1 Tax=Macroventuria anomochaeta TaxID=301207 RepID=A0ACB6RWD9_9PLEO|nr:uncharacterized protein BU25DRAFT_101036 [Macroventuria anomochaeta]KAF2626089.1 hypothetical protein BU25DRAFT_101036 [Macroventuria anomochaeta]
MTEEMAGSSASLLRRHIANQHCPMAKFDPAHHRGRCSSTCPWRRCRTAGNGLKTFTQQTKHCALGYHERKHLRCSSCCLSGHQQQCDVPLGHTKRAATSSLPRRSLASKRAQFPRRSSNARPHEKPPAKPPTTVKQLNRARQMPHPAGTDAKLDDSPRRLNTATMLNTLPPSCHPTSGLA